MGMAWFPLKQGQGACCFRLRRCFVYLGALSAVANQHAARAHSASSFLKNDKAVKGRTRNGWKECVKARRVSVTYGTLPPSPVLRPPAVPMIFSGM